MSFVVSVFNYVGLWLRRMAIVYNQGLIVGPFQYHARCVQVSADYNLQSGSDLFGFKHGHAPHPVVQFSSRTVLHWKYSGDKDKPSICINQIKLQS